MDERMLDTLEIKEVVENWAVFRDSGDWDRFRGVWHEEGVMMATWFQGPYEEFIRVNQEGWNKGVSILHLLGGTSVEVAGIRAIAQTKMTISQRALVYGVMVDVLCTGRFYDFFEKRNDAGPLSCAGFFMRRIAWTRSIHRKWFNWTQRFWRSFRRAIATWLICSPAWDSR